MEAGNNSRSRRRSRFSLQTNNKMDYGPKYSKVSESFRHATSGSMQCSMFCGGRQCKYENPEKWSDVEMAIKGLYSSWVTDSILAMARPSTRLLKKFDIIQQFQRWGITAVINLQHPGEHANCGFGLEKGGFTYNPEDFMNSEIYFYNFVWRDYGVRSLESVLDMVKVMDFALQEGKVAVHCHAGLGRTGVLIACYLIFSLRMTPEQAIHTIRIKRPKSVQTRGQISCVQDFSKFLKPLWVIFPSRYMFGVKPFTLQKYLIRQRHMLHGYEARELKYIPKIIFVVCRRLLEICCLDPNKLKLTDDRAADRTYDGAEVNDFNSDVKDALDVEDQLTSNISASMEDLKGEYDECDIPVNNVLGALSQTLSNSQPTDVISYEQESFLKPLSRRNSDSVLCKVHDKQAECELQPKPEGHRTVSKRETKTNRETDDDLEITISKQTKKIELKHFHQQLNEATPVNSFEKYTEVELAATALASDSKMDDEIMARVQMLQRVLNECNGGWENVESESNLCVLTALMYSWVKNLAMAKQVISYAGLMNFFLKDKNSIRKGEIKYHSNYLLEAKVIDYKIKASVRASMKDKSYKVELHVTKARISFKDRNRKHKSTADLFQYEKPQFCATNRVRSDGDRQSFYSTLKELNVYCLFRWIIFSEHHDTKDPNAPPLVEELLPLFATDKESFMEAIKLKKEQ